MDETRIEEMITGALIEAKRDGLAQGIIWAVVLSVGFLVFGVVIGYMLSTM